MLAGLCERSLLDLNNLQTARLPRPTPLLPPEPGLFFP